jgi:hypothetical protein
MQIEFSIAFFCITYLHLVDKRYLSVLYFRKSSSSGNSSVAAACSLSWSGLLNIRKHYPVHGCVRLTRFWWRLPPRPSAWSLPPSVEHLLMCDPLLQTLSLLLVAPVFWLFVQEPDTEATCTVDLTVHWVQYCYQHRSGDIRSITIGIFHKQYRWKITIQPNLSSQTHP